MRAALALAVLAACSSADSAPDQPGPAKPGPAKPGPAKPTPPKPVASGTISGAVTITISGPGRMHSPEENTSSTHAIDCDVAITGKGAARSEHTAKDSGRFDATVPEGTYTLSFAACVQPCCAGIAATRELTVTAGKTTTADWSCKCAAK